MATRNPVSWAQMTSREDEGQPDQAGPKAHRRSTGNAHGRGRLGDEGGWQRLVRGLRHEPGAVAPFADDRAEHAPAIRNRPEVALPVLALVLEAGHLGHPQ